MLSNGYQKCLDKSLDGGCNDKNSYIYYKLHPNLLLFLDFKFVVRDWLDYLHSNKRISMYIAAQQNADFNTSRSKWIAISLTWVLACQTCLLFDWWDWKSHIRVCYMWYTFVPLEGEKLFSAWSPTHKQLKKQYLQLFDY